MEEEEEGEEDGQFIYLFTCLFIYRERERGREGEIDR